ncbi:unnamed protein product [Amoebophrya sp. A120]|nr:unnamed protein product [Amoebophrya sp. A120]|eukprot:GSA120T00007552001.1
MLHSSRVLFIRPGHRENWCKRLRKYKKNTWDWEDKSISEWLCNQPFQEASRFTHPAHLDRYGFPRYPQTPGNLRPDRDRAKYCNMSSVHNQDMRNRGLRRPEHLIHSLGGEHVESGHHLLKAKGIKYVRSFV